MKSEGLARLLTIARGERPSVTPQGVSVTPSVTPETPAVTPVTAVTCEIEQQTNENLDAATAANRAPRDDIEAATEERAGLADCVPAAYLDTWARLNCQRPFGVSEADWRRALEDGGLFLDEFGNEAAKLGWRPGAVFDVGRGLIWKLRGERVLAVETLEVHLRNGLALNKRG
jgi:hypothetical protein